MRVAVDGFEFETFSGVFIAIIFQRDLTGLWEDNQLPFVRRDRYVGTGPRGYGQIGSTMHLSSRTDQSRFMRFAEFSANQADWF